MEEERFQRSVPVKLTQDEYVTMGKQMSREQNEMTNLTLRLKEVSADFKGKIAQKEAMINSLSVTISNGYEYRDTDCAYAYRPADGKKDIIRMDTGEIIATEQMTKTDFQNMLPFEKEAPVDGGDVIGGVIMIEEKSGVILGAGPDEETHYKLNA